MIKQSKLVKVTDTRVYLSQIKHTMHRSVVWKIYIPEQRNEINLNYDNFCEFVTIRNENSVSALSASLAGI
jgi:hypothetical protein